MRVYCDDYQDMHDFNDLMDNMELVLESAIRTERNKDNPDNRYIVETEELLRKFYNVQSAIDKVVVR